MAFEIPATAKIVVLTGEKRIDIREPGA